MLDPNVIAVEILGEITNVPTITNQTEATAAATNIWEQINTALIKYYTGSVVAIYIRAATIPTTPTEDNPLGWSTSVPTGGSPLWLSIGTKNTITNLIDNWSIPIPLDGGGGGTAGFYSGFLNYYNDTTLAFTNATRTFTITATGTSYVFYVTGNYFSKASDSLVITDVEGSHLIYYDATGTLVESVNPSEITASTIIKTYTFVSYIYWNATASVSVIGPLKEQHGLFMDGDTHIYLHTNFRCRWVSGLGLSSILSDQNGSLASHAQWGSDLGIIQDEDLRHSISAISSTSGFPVYYNSGINSYLRRDTLSTFGVLTTGTGRLAYNNINAGGVGIWGLSEVSNNDFVLYHVFATNDPNNSIISVMGQSIYTTLANARTGATTELLNLLVSFPSPEFKAIGTVIFQTSDSYTNAVNARIRSTDTGATYIDWRKEQIGTIISPSDHNGLLNLQSAGSGVTFGHITDTTQTIAGDKTFSGTTAFTSLGVTTGLPIITGSGSTIVTGSFGTTTGTFCSGDDSRIGTTTNNQIIKFDSGTTEGTDLYTFNGSSEKTIDILAGNNVTLTKTEGEIIIDSIQNEGILNYILNPDFETDITGWNTYNDGDVATPVDGTGGEATITFVRSTTNPLYGTASGLFTHGASNVRGQGISYDFEINPGSVKAPLYISFAFKDSTGTMLATDIRVYIYNITDSTLISPSLIALPGSSSAIQKYHAIFTPVATSINYRLILHCTSTVTTNFNIDIDDFLITDLSIDGIIYSYSTSTVGYTMYSNGILEQWGWDFIAGDSVNRIRLKTCNFPISFLTGTLPGTFLLHHIGYKNGSDPTSIIDTAGIVVDTWASGRPLDASTFSGGYGSGTIHTANSRFLFSWYAKGRWK